MNGGAGEGTGLEQLRAALSGEATGIAELLGITVVDLTHGHVAFDLEPNRRMLNPLGTVHGGVAATLLDSVASCAVHSALPAGATYATTQLNVHFVRPIHAGTPVLRGTGDLVHLGRTMATATATITDHVGQLVAHGTVTCAVRPVRSPAA